MHAFLMHAFLMHAFLMRAFLMQAFLMRAFLPPLCFANPTRHSMQMLLLHRANCTSEHQHVFSCEGTRERVSEPMDRQA